MHADDNYKGSFIKNDLTYCHVSRNKSDEWLSFLNRGSMSWSVMHGNHGIICYSELPSLQVMLVSIGKGTKCVLFSL